MILRTENLVKRYRSRTVVNHVSIQVGQGEIVGLLGPNGAGKTTTFYMTVGLVVPNEGRIYLDDQDITKYPVYRRAQAGIGYLAQEASIYRKLSVEDNILSVLELTNRTKQEQQARLEELIAEFRLERYVRTLVTASRVVSVVVLRSLAVWPLTRSSLCLTSRSLVSTLSLCRIFRAS